jgi:hypothetical protein
MWFHSLRVTLLEYLASGLSEKSSPSSILNLYAGDTNLFSALLVNITFGIPSFLGILETLSGFGFKLFLAEIIYSSFIP